MGLAEMFSNGMVKQGPGDTKTVGETSYPMSGFEIFMHDLMTDPMKVFDVYKRGQAQPIPQVGMSTSPTPTPTMPSTLTEEVSPQPAIDPWENENKRRRVLQELLKQI